MITKAEVIAKTLDKRLGEPTKGQLYRAMRFAVYGGAQPETELADILHALAKELGLTLPIK